MTDVRTYPRSASIEKDTQLTKYNFADCPVTRPSAYYNNPSGIVSSYGFAPTYDNTGPGKTFWDGSKAYQGKVMDDNSNPVNPSNVAVGVIRRFYPGTIQLWDWQLGLHSGALAVLLKELDWSYERGIRHHFILGLYQQDSKISLKPFGYVKQNSALFETRIIAYLEALFTSTQTSSLGYTVANHPALYSIECGNEDNLTTNDNTGTFMAGNIHANIDRIVHQVIRNRENPIHRGKTIDILGHSSKGTLPIEYTLLMGAEAVSQADTVLGNGTLASSTISLAGHTFVDWDEVLLESVDFPDTYQEDTYYYAVNVSANVFQLSTTPNGAPVAAASADSILDFFQNLNAYTNHYTNSITPVVTYSAATNTFTATGHTLPRINSITRSGLTATVTLAAASSLKTGDTVTISGAVEPEYNGSFTINVSTSTVFTYTMASSPATSPATGTLKLSTPYAGGVLVGRIGNGTVDSGISSYRRYYVRDVVAGTSFKLADGILGTSSNALTFTGTANVKVRKHTPAKLYGDDGSSRNTTHYINHERSHMYGTIYAGSEWQLEEYSNRQNWNAPIFNFEEAGFLPFALHQRFGMYMRGPVTVSGAVFTSTKRLNLTQDSRVQIFGTTMPTNTAKDSLYYAVNIDNDARTFGISTTKNGTAITTGSAGSGLLVALAHPYYGKKERPSLWNTESSENGNQTTFQGQQLSPTRRFDFHLAHTLSRLMKTDDGAGGCGVTFYFGSELGSKGAYGVLKTVTLGSNAGNLEVTFSSAFASTPVAGKSMLHVFTDVNAIPGVLAANSFKEFLVLSGSGLTWVLDVPYTGGDIGGVEVTLDDSCFFSADIRRAVIQHLTSAPIKFGFCTLDNEAGSEVRGAIWYALDGVGAWYFDHTGVRHQW